MIPCSAPSDAHIDFIIVNCPFHDSNFIAGIPFIHIPLDSRKYTEVHIFVGIGGSSPFSDATRFFTVRRPTALLTFVPWGNPIYRSQPVPFYGNVLDTSCLKKSLLDKRDGQKDCIVKATSVVAVLGD